MPRTIPIIIQNVTLKIELSVPERNEALLDDWLAQVEEVKKNFGKDTIVENITSLLPGHIESVEILGGVRVAPVLESNPSAGTNGTGPVLEGKVNSPAPDPLYGKECLSLGDSHILGSWRYKGKCLAELDIDEVWYNLGTRKQMFLKKDIPVIEAYYYCKKGLPQKKTYPETSLENDNIPGE